MAQPMRSCLRITNRQRADAKNMAKMRQAKEHPNRRIAAKTSKVLPLAALAAGLASCSSVGVLNALEPKSNVIATRDLVYQTGDRGRLDVYRPVSAAESAPVIVFIYGGGWDSGRKADYSFVGDALASKGFVAVIADYRLYPEVRWPAFLEDNAKAVRWAHDHAAEFGGDPHKLFLVGHSAGAYNAAMLTLDRRWLEAVGLDARNDIRGMVGLAGPYDFLPLRSEELKIIFGPEQDRPATQPINYVDGKAAPLFLAADLGDKVVDPGNSTRLAQRIEAAGGRVQVKMYKGLNHALIVGVLAAPLRFLGPVLKDLTAFITNQLAQAPEAKTAMIGAGS